MIKQSKPTNEQVQLIKKLHKLKSEVWDSDSPEIIIQISQKAIMLAKHVQPIKYTLASGMEKINTKGKQLALDLLDSDIKMLDNKGYLSLEDEKFAVVISIQNLIGAYVHLSAQELLKILEN